MKEAKLLQYLKLDLNLHRKLGGDCAILFATLNLLSKHQKLDEYGFFRVDHAFIQANLGFGRDKLLRTRKKLIENNCIQVIDGLNQNQKPRYKIIPKKAL